MDFSKFLLNDSKQTDCFTPIKILHKNKTHEKDISIQQACIQTKNQNKNQTKKQKNTNTNLDVSKTTFITPQKTLQEQHSFKKGDFIVITGVENSPLNIYKGYFGEIKYLIPRNNSAYITFEAMNNSNALQIPFGHFKHRF
jgi:CHAT domain-containing protein